MGLKRQIERLQKWACSKANNSCEKCSYSVFGGTYMYFCTIGITADAAEDRAKEGKNNEHE